MTHRRLDPAELVHRCDASAFAFDTTAELPDLDEIVGHRRAVGAVDFGIAIRARGFNLYAMGPEGIGKYTLIRQFLAARAAGEPVPDDWCYTYNFDDPRRPRTLRLPAGTGVRLRDRMAQLVRELRAAIPAALETDHFRTRKQALEDEAKARREAALVEFEGRSLGLGVALVRTPVGVGLAPIRAGKVMEASDLEALPEPERRAIRAGRVRGSPEPSGPWSPASTGSPNAPASSRRRSSRPRDRTDHERDPGDRAPGPDDDRDLRH